MIHNKKQSNPFLTLAAIGLFSLVLAACDNGGGETENSAAANGAEEVYSGPDFSEVISAEEVRGDIVYGEITLGNPDAPVTMIEYASLTCPHCATFHNSIFPALKDKYVKTGKVKVVFRNFIRDRLDVAVSMIARCYGPDKSFALLDLYFQRQRQWMSNEPLPEIAAIARTAGISRVELDSCLANSELQAHLLEMQKAGSAAGVSGTPTFFINGEKHVGAGSVEFFSEIFDGEL